MEEDDVASTTSWLQHETVDAMTREEEEEEENSATGSWESIGNEIEIEIETEAGPCYNKEKEEEFQPSMASVKLDKSSFTSKWLLLVVSSAALLLAMFLQEGPRENSILLVSNDTLRQPTTSAPVVQTATTETSPINSTQTAKQLPETKGTEYPDDSTFLWLSLDDDVIAGQVFWENQGIFGNPKDGLTGSLPNPKGPPTSTDIITVTQQKMDILRSKLNDYVALRRRQPPPGTGGMQKGPLDWVVRHCQRLNVHLLGQSQLTRLKRRQYNDWIVMATRQQLVTF